MSEVLPREIQKAFKTIDEHFLKVSRNKLDKESKEIRSQLESMNKDNFDLRKDLLILAGTIFGASIALSTGRLVNYYFIFGEVFLLFSLIAGFIILTMYIKNREWSYAFESKNSLESFLLLNKRRISDFEKEGIENLIKDYNKIINSNQKGLIYSILKYVKIDNWPQIFDMCFFIGIILILISLLPDKLSNNLNSINTPLESNYKYNEYEGFKKYLFQ